MFLFVIFVLSQLPQFKRLPSHQMASLPMHCNGSLKLKLSKNKFIDVGSLELPWISLFHIQSEFVDISWKSYLSTSRVWETVSSPRQDIVSLKYSNILSFLFYYFYLQQEVFVHFNHPFTLPEPSLWKLENLHSETIISNEAKRYSEKFTGLFVNCFPNGGKWLTSDIGEPGWWERDQFVWFHDLRSAPGLSPSRTTSLLPGKSIYAICS